VIAPVPPPVINVTLLAPPLQAIADAVAEIVIGVGCVMVIVVDFVQAFASVAVNV
jgi:hypothetical protein